MAMNKDEEALTRKWIECWRRAGPELERIRRKEIREADTARFVQATAGLLGALKTQLSNRKTSGLVQQQEYFRGLARRTQG
jgi:hypothetical protein